MKPICEFLVNNKVENIIDQKYPLITSLKNSGGGDYIKFKDYDEQTWICKVTEISKDKIKGPWILCTTEDDDDDMWGDDNHANFDRNDIKTISKKLTVQDKLYIDLVNDYVEHHHQKVSFYLNKKTLQFKKG